MTKRLAAIAVGAAVLGAVGSTAPTAMAETTAVTCGTHTQDSGTTRYSYYGNCADSAVNIHVEFVYFPPGSEFPVLTDEGDHCVPAQTDYLMGTMSTDDNAGYVASEIGTC